ncbi:hypothetical protein [Sporomusa sp. KB1]|nr:hypothetical protein [Sporomusa sp. KB1]
MDDLIAEPPFPIYVKDIRQMALRRQQISIPRYGQLYSDILAMMDEVT